VYLRGPVHSQEESTRIQQMVRQVEGVTDVMNELHIQQELGS
jgi:osmotically-inducible protein OsmY